MIGRIVPGGPSPGGEVTGEGLVTELFAQLDCLLTSEYVRRTSHTDCFSRNMSVSGAAVVCTTGVVVNKEMDPVAELCLIQ